MAAAKIVPGGFSGATIKSYYFDRALVRQFVGKRIADSLSQWGAFIQKTAQNSLRRRKNPSKPGQTPSRWANGNLSIKDGKAAGVKFFYDPYKKSVVIGWPAAQCHKAFHASDMGFDRNDVSADDPRRIAAGSWCCYSSS